MGIYFHILQLQPNFLSLNAYRNRLIELLRSGAGAEFLSLTVHFSNCQNSNYNTKYIMIYLLLKKLNWNMLIENQT